MGLDCVQHLRHLKAREQDQGGSRHHGQVLTGAQTIHMKKWDDPQEDFPALLEIRDPGSALHRIGDHVAMGQHDAFWCSRRAAGVLQQREIIRGRSGQRVR